MNKREQENREHEKRDHKKHEHEKHERECRAHRIDKDSGDDPQRHAKILARRWLGSPAPTPERYANALRQWRALPGAVVSPASDVTAQPPKSTGSRQVAARKES